MNISPSAGNPAEPSMLIDVRFRGADYLRCVVEEAQAIVNDALAAAQREGVDA